MTENYKPNRILVNQRTANDYIVSLATPIGEIDEFEDILQLLMSCREEDTIHFDVVSPGGSIDTAHILIRGINKTEARTSAYIGPTCASAATAIVLACDEWEIDDMSSFMVHTGSFMCGGMAPHVAASVNHTNKMIERFVRNTYTGFLEESEIESVLDARELYFEGEELANRLVAYSEYREELRLANMDCDCDECTDVGCSGISIDDDEIDIDQTVDSEGQEE